MRLWSILRQFPRFIAKIRIRVVIIAELMLRLPIYTAA